MAKKIMVGIIVIFIIVGGVFLSQNKKSENTVSLPEFRLSVNSWIGFGPFYLAQEKGFFTEQGVDFKITMIEDVGQKKIALLQGSIDGIADTVDSLILSRSQAVPVVAVMELDVSDGADAILATKDIETIQDLKGKKIAVQKNFVSEAFLNYVLQKNGMSPNDVQTIDTEAGAAGAAFVSKNVDVAVTFEPWISKAKERTDAHVLITSKTEPGVLVDVLNVQEAYLKQNPETVQKIMRAWFKALEYIQNNPTESYEIMAKHYNMPATEFATIIADGVVWPNFDQNIAYFKKENSTNIYSIANVFIEVFKKTGQISSPLNMEQAISSTLLEHLYEKK